MSTGGWLHSEQKKKGLEILREIGITDAVKVGISTAGNIKYTNPEGRIQIVQRTRYKIQVDAIRKIANASGIGASSGEGITTKQVKLEILNYENTHWEDIRKIWAEIWGSDDVVLSEEDHGETFEFHSKLTREVFTASVYKSGVMMTQDYRADGNYEDYFRNQLQSICTPIVASSILQTDHVQKIEKAAEDFFSCYLKVVQEIFAQEFPKTKAEMIYEKSVSSYQPKRGRNGGLVYQGYIKRLQDQNAKTIHISVQVPSAGIALATINGPDFEKYVKFADQNGKMHNLRGDLDDCTCRALQNKNALNRNPVCLPITEDNKQQIRKELRKACKDMQLQPNEKFKAKVDAIFKHYCDLNKNTPFVPVLNTGKNKAPNYEKAYNLGNKRVNVRTVYGIISTRGMVEKKPFTEMLDKFSDPNSSLAKKKQATDEAMTEYNHMLLLGKYELSVTCSNHKYPYLDGSPLTMETFAFGREISRETGEIQGRTAKAYDKRLREELDKTYKEIEQEVKQVCREKMEANREWLDNPIVPAVIRYIEKNEEYVTENAVIQALRGTTVQLQSVLHETPECGKLNRFPVDEVKRVIDKMIHFNIIHEHSIDGKYGVFYILQMNANAETLLLLDAKLQKEKEEKHEAHEMVFDAMTANPYQFSAFLTETKKKHEAGEDILKDQITLLQSLGNYYFTGYYFEEITEILSMDFSDSVKTYLEMMVFATKDNASLSKNHKKLIAKIQTTVKKMVKEKKKESKEKASAREELA